MIHDAIAEMGLGLFLQGVAVAALNGALIYHALKGWLEDRERKQAEDRQRAREERYRRGVAELRRRNRERLAQDLYA